MEKQCGVLLSKNALNTLKMIETEDEVLKEIRQKCEKKTGKSECVLGVGDLKRLENSLKNIRKGENIPYLHELLKDCELHIPAYQPPPRNPELEARIQKLKLELEEQSYKRMTADVDVQVKRSHSDFSMDVKAVRSQVIAVVNFVLTVGGSFMFAYKAVEYSLPVQNIAAQVLLGVITATVVGLAELYFLAKYMMD